MKEQLRKFIVDNFLFGLEDSSFSDSDSFLEKGLIDSTGVLELVSFLEESFGIRVEDDELVPENLDSIDAILHYLDSKLVPVPRLTGSANVDEQLVA